MAHSTDGRNLGGSYPAADRATDKASFLFAVQVSVREWARSTIGPKFRRGEAVWSAAVTYKHGLARPEFGKTASPESFHMHKNIRRLGTTGRKPNPRSRLNHFTAALSQSPSGTTTTWVRWGNSDGRIAVESSMLQMRTACSPLELLTTSQTTRAPSQAVWNPPFRRQDTCRRTSGRFSSGTIKP